MKVIQSPQFTKKIKKFHDYLKKILDVQNSKLLENHRIGDEKRVI